MSLGSYPDFLPAVFPFAVFLVRVFSGLRPTSFISVSVSGSSALLVFSFFPVSYSVYLVQLPQFCTLLYLIYFYVC